LIKNKKSEADTKMTRNLEDVYQMNKQGGEAG
jgi:hypothetical protein